MESEITTNATQYIYIKPSTCGNCKFWRKHAPINLGICGRISHETTQARVGAGDWIETYIDFGCTLYQEKESEAEGE